MKILIIGSKGFIGSHCVSFFSRAHEVWGTDIYTDYNEKNFILFDALSTSHNSPFQNYKFDICINCAGAASVPDSWTYPMRDFDLNTNLVARLLDFIRLYNSDCKFINISSAAVYGSPTSLPVKESAPLAPLSPYGKHKVFAEQIVSEFFQFYNIKTCSLRIFSAYGEGLKKQIFWDWHLKSKDNNLLVLPGTGEESRDYIYAADIISAIDILLLNAKWQGECYNIGSGKQHYINEVAEIFFKQLKWQGTLQFDGIRRPGEPIHWQADISKLNSMGFRPVVALEEGLRRYIKWIRTL